MFTGRCCARSWWQTASRRQRYEIVAAIGGGWRRQRQDGRDRRGGRGGRGQSRFCFNTGKCPTIKDELQGSSCESQETAMNQN